MAFAGGLDLSKGRWDTPKHPCEDPRRTDLNGTMLPPHHDVQIAVDGKAAAALSVKRTRMVILLSDINEWLHRGRPLRWLEARFGKNKLMKTFPSPFPLFGLDRIWVSPPPALVDVSCFRTPLTHMASDHIPLIARIQTPNPEIRDEGP